MIKPPPPEKRYRNLAILLIALVLVYHLIIIGIIGLGDNEAYYWTWSKHIDISYYDHPGIVAYLIWLTTAIGGDNAFSVRVGTAILFALTTLFVYLTTVDIFKSRRAGFYAVILTNIVPLYFIVGLITVPDAPLAALWALFLYLLWRTTKGVDPWYWYLLGAVVGLAFLAKYFAVLLFPSTLLFLLSDKRLRKYLKTPHPYLGVLLAFVIMSPVFIWNARHGWPSFEFHLVERQSGFAWDNVGKMIGGQMSMTPILLYFLFAALWVAVKRGFSKGGDVGYKFIVLTSVPTLLFFYIAMCFIHKAEPHWPALGYVPLVIAAAGLYPEYLAKWGKKKLADFGWIRALGLGRVGGWMRRTSAFKTLVALGVAFPLFFILFMNVQIFYPLYRPEKTKYDITNDFYGWDKAAARVRELSVEMEKETGRAPFIFSYHYNPASQLSWALKDWTNVYCLSRKTDQFDFWQDPATLVGHDGVYVINDAYDSPPEERYYFDRIEGPETITTWRAGGVKGRTFMIYRCYGYRGMKE
jgi:4-amino-4-deoxy-L-arabinose transferase-like glycosyltransferase